MAKGLSSGLLTPDFMRMAYRQGSFPMVDGDLIEFYRPAIRALLPISGITVSRSLAKVIRQQRFRITIDQAFEQVIRSCAACEETWLNEELIEVNLRIHDEGWAHSCEAWLDGELAGGVYGLAIGAWFSGESMFSHRSNASKVALHHLVRHCNDLGFQAFDCQLINPHTASLGAYMIPNREAMRTLQRLRDVDVAWTSL